jgi:hypothetical protein
MQPVESQLSSNRQEKNDSGIVGIGRQEEEEEEDQEEERNTYSYEYIPLSINDWTVPVGAVYVSILPIYISVVINYIWKKITCRLYFYGLATAWYTCQNGLTSPTN